jgi:hypothetical protein
MSKALAGLLLQAVLLGLGAYVGLSEDAIQASPFGRAAIVALFVACAFLLGEVNRNRAHMRALITLLKGGITTAAGERDDRAAIDVLVRALTSADGDVRAKAHKNLLRLTGQGFGPDPAAWTKWWEGARPTFPRHRESPE